MIDTPSESAPRLSPGAFGVMKTLAEVVGQRTWIRRAATHLAMLGGNVAGAYGWCDGNRVLFGASLYGTVLASELHRGEEHPIRASWIVHSLRDDGTPVIQNATWTTPEAGPSSPTEEPGGQK
jgi:hypothetical protein